MHIPVGVYAAAAVTERGTFSCGRCKHWQRAEVSGRSLGAATLFGGGDTARERARANASRDVMRTLRFATCPRCGKRSGHGAFIRPYLVQTFAITAVAFAFAFVAPVALNADWDAGEVAAFHRWFPVLVLAILAISVPGTVVSKWRSTDRRVRWLEF